MYLRRNQMRLSWLAVLALVTTPAPSDIRTASFRPCGSLDLTAVGTKDWALFGPDSLQAGDFKSGGAGIAREIRITGALKKREGTPFTGAAWGWSDGTREKSLVRHNGSEVAPGLRLWLDAGAAVAFEFAAPPRGEIHQAHLLFRSDGKARIVARQGNLDREVAVLGGSKSAGLAVVRYDGDGPLSIAIVNPEKKELVLRGFAAALSGPVDFEGAPPGVPTRQEIALRRAAGLGPVDFLGRATDFADCMIRFGRDRYGKVHSPLFANALTREPEPRTTPYPIFAEPDREAKSMNTPFRRFDFNRVLNYPAGLGEEGPHKVTVYGCDPLEDRDLYDALFEITRVTGDAKYRAEAEKALDWWFRHTQGPAGLYPWGEHLGWDFEHEGPTFFAGPCRHLYAACYHEIKDEIPFLDHLLRLPAEKTGDLTPAEKYALGIWNAHFWDKEKAYYCRHGDYTGEDDRKGSDAGFPAHLGAYLHVWSAVYLGSSNADFRRTMDGVFDRVLDMAVSRTEKYGFFPFTFEPELKGKAPKKEVPGQSLRLARHAREVGRRLEEANPRAAAKLARLAELHLGPERPAPPGTPRPEPRVRDLSDSDRPNDYADEILAQLAAYRQYGDEAYLKAAETAGRLAVVHFCDGKCPLPKARIGSDRFRTAQGEPFPDFTFRGARLMRAFALLGEARRAGPPAAPR